MCSGLSIKNISPAVSLYITKPSYGNISNAIPNYFLHNNN